MSLQWTRHVGRGPFSYFTAETPLGRVRISRVNRHGVAGFRVYYPDGKQITQSSVEEAQNVAEAYVDALLAGPQPTPSIDMSKQGAEQ